MKYEIIAPGAVEDGMYRDLTKAKISAIKKFNGETVEWANVWEMGEHLIMRFSISKYDETI